MVRASRIAASTLGGCTKLPRNSTRGGSVPTGSLGCAGRSIPGAIRTTRASRRERSERAAVLLGESNDGVGRGQHATLVAAPGDGVDAAAHPPQAALPSGEVGRRGRARVVLDQDRGRRGIAERGRY